MVACAQGTKVCGTILLVDEETLDYRYYYINLRFLNAGILGDDLIPFVGTITESSPYIYTFCAGDVRFEFTRAHDGFSSLELGFRTTFMFVTCAVIAATFWGLRHSPVAEWSWEQRALALLLFGLLLLNSMMHT